MTSYGHASLILLAKGILVNVSGFWERHQSVDTSKRLGEIGKVKKEDPQSRVCL